VNVVLVVMLGEEGRVLLHGNTIVAVMSDVGKSGTSYEGVVVVASMLVLL